MAKSSKIKKAQAPPTTPPSEAQDLSPGLNKLYGGAQEKNWTIRPPDDVRELVKRAMIATGKKRQTILISVIREKLAEVVENYLSRTEEARRSFRRDYTPPETK